MKIEITSTCEPLSVMVDYDFIKKEMFDFIYEQVGFDYVNSYYKININHIERFFEEMKQRESGK